MTICASASWICGAHVPNVRCAPQPIAFYLSPIFDEKLAQISM
jgi:hypothetical protein